MKTERICNGGLSSVILVIIFMSRTCLRNVLHFDQDSLLWSAAFIAAITAACHFYDHSEIIWNTAYLCCTEVFFFLRIYDFWCFFFFLFYHIELTSMVLLKSCSFFPSFCFCQMLFHSLFLDVACVVFLEAEDLMLFPSRASPTGFHLSVGNLW